MTAVVTDRRSYHTILAKMERQCAEEMNNCLALVIAHCPVTLQTVTVDNDKEFARYDLLRKNTGVHCYFTDTYSTWQKGTMENTTGVLRRWLPKKCDLSKVEQQ